MKHRYALFVMVGFLFYFGGQTGVSYADTKANSRLASADTKPPCALMCSMVQQLTKQQQPRHVYVVQYT